MLGRYRTLSANAIGVNLQISTGNPVELGLFRADYVAPNGVQVRATESYGADSLRGGASTFVMILFTDVEPGGTLYIEVSDSDFSGLPELAIPVPTV